MADESINNEKQKLDANREREKQMRKLEPEITKLKQDLAFEEQKVFNSDHFKILWEKYQYRVDTKSDPPNDLVEALNIIKNNGMLSREFVSKELAFDADRLYRIGVRINKKTDKWRKLYVESLLHQF